MFGECLSFSSLETIDLMAECPTAPPATISEFGDSLYTICGSEFVWFGCGVLQPLHTPLPGKYIGRLNLHTSDGCSKRLNSGLRGVGLRGSNTNNGEVFPADPLQSDIHTSSTKLLSLTVMIKIPRSALVVRSEVSTDLA